MAAVISTAFFIRKKIAKKKDNQAWFSIIFIGIALIWSLTYLLINPILIGYGNPLGIDGMVSSHGKLYVVDYLASGGSRYSDPEACSRIHILDAATGTKILRFPAHEHGELTGVKGDSLIFHYYYDTGIFSASTGKLISKWNNKTLPKIFPELASGIDHVMIERSAMILELTTLDGNHWNLSLRTGNLWAAKQNNEHGKYIPTNRLYLNNDNELKIDDQPGGKILLKIDGSTDSQEIRYLKTDNGTVVNEDLKFIMGSFIAFSPQQKCFAVMSYETTKEIGFILTGVTLDGKTKLWELRQSELRPNDDRQYQLPTAFTFDNKTDILYFGMKDEVMALEISTGKILWRQKL
jgi:hypothetical protein